jgi:hypothetical protein
MIDLETITAICPGVDLPTNADLVAARRQLGDAISKEIDATQACSKEGDVAPTALPLRRRRRVVRLALAGGVAAAAAGLAAVLVVPSGSPPGGLQGVRPVSHLAAVQFLDKAAAAALQQPSRPPLPAQFVYSETEDPDGTLTETWLSVDGLSSGLSRWAAGTGAPDPGATGSNDLGPSCSIVQGEAKGCSPFVGYYPDLPTDPNAVLAYLNQVGLIDTASPSDDALPGWEDNVVGKTVSELMASSYLLPAQQAALFKLMAQTPGFQIVSPMTDAIGRSGIGLEWTFEGGTAAVIFDPTTYAYLGSRTWPGPADPNAPYDGDALVKLAVVASAGEQP